MVSEALARNKDLIPTPDIPEGTTSVELSDNAYQVLTRRYLRKGDDGKPAETVEDMFWRVGQSKRLFRLAGFQEIPAKFTHIYRCWNAFGAARRLLRFANFR
jgi:hypothetical protein